jgi:hypothetical protein
MNAKTTVLVFAFAAAIATVACRHHKETHAGELEREFQIAPAAQTLAGRKAWPDDSASSPLALPADQAVAQSLARQTVTAIQERNYATAATRLQALQVQPQLTPKQRLAVQHTMEAVQMNLAAQFANGNPSARLKAEQLRESVRR